LEDPIYSFGEDIAFDRLGVVGSDSFEGVQLLLGSLGISCGRGMKAGYLTFDISPTASWVRFDNFRKYRP